MRLDVFLAELLYDHDCVIIPGFGGLVANYRAARLHTRTHYIVPPAKHVGFNRNLVQSDGLLAHYISNVTGWSYDQAVLSIQNEVMSYLTDLSENKRVVWDRIGFLFRDRSGNLQFVPSENENFLVSSFGLQPIQLKPVALEMTTDEKIISHPAVAISTNKRKPWLTAAAISVPVLIASALLLNNQLNQNGQLGFNPFKSDPVKSDYSPRTTTESETGISTPKSLNDYILDSTTTIRYNFEKNAPDENGITIVVNPVPAKTSPSASTSSSDKRYAVIGGAFMIEENADKLIAQLRAKGFDAQRAGMSKGLHLVAFGKYSTDTEARKAMEEIRKKENLKAWLKKI